MSAWTAAFGSPMVLPLYAFPEIDDNFLYQMTAEAKTKLALKSAGNTLRYG